MSVCLSTHDARRWTAIAEVLVHYLQAWIECLKVSSHERTLPASLPNGMFCAAERFLQRLLGNISGRSARSLSVLSDYLIGLESLPEQSAGTSEMAAAAIESFLRCLRALNEGRSHEVSLEMIEATLVFFLRLQTQGDRARENRVAFDESPLLDRKT